MVRGSWFVVRGSWFVVRDSWFVVRGLCCQTLPQVIHGLVHYNDFGLHAGRGEKTGDLGAVLLFGETRVEGSERI